jgi:signal transduction histidine kinase
MAKRLSEYYHSTLTDLMASKRYLETVINSMKEPIIGLDNSMKILFINDEALKTLNLKGNALIGKSAEDISISNDLLRKLIRGVINENGDLLPAKKSPLSIYSNDKENYFKVEYLHIELPQDKNRNTQMGYVILLQNVTEYQELNAAKTTFISTISHELKTPISAIMMSLQLLEDERVGKLSNEQKELAESIKDNSERLLNITGELLNITKVESGKLQLKPKITKPIELIDYAIKANRVQAERFGIHIEVEYPDNGKIGKLFVDSEKIAWVLTNLVSNAIHYSYENGRVIIGARQSDHNHIEMYVRDFGKGIDKRYHESIFDHYFRVPGTKVQGSGLGLAISRDFVEAHGGTIHVESEMDKGSCFIISLAMA